MGFLRLHGRGLLKVTAANELYRFAIKVLMVCWELNIVVSIENPERSWLWAVLTKLVLEQNNQPFTLWFNTLDRISFHACMHGGARAM